MAERYPFQRAPGRTSGESYIKWHPSSRYATLGFVPHAWYTSVTASDSSIEGAGVCTRDLPISLVRRFCKTSERWHFGFEDAVRARIHAFGQSACLDVERELLSAGQHLIL